MRKFLRTQAALIALLAAASFANAHEKPTPASKAGDQKVKIERSVKKEASKPADKRPIKSLLED